VLRVQYRSAPPCERLSSSVARYWQIESTGPVPGSAGRWALPDGGSEWVFVLAAPLVRASQVHRAGAYAAGTALSAYASRPAGAMLTFGVAFRPGGAAAVSRLPASELTNRVVPLEILWGPAAGGLAERLFEAGGFRARVELIQAELLARLRPLDAEVSEVVGRLSANPSMAVASLSPDAAAARRLERIFQARVGIGPKRLARMLRLQRATQLWAKGRVAGWAELALAAGYSDQSHMIREFRELTGATPARSAERDGWMSDSFYTAGRRSMTVNGGERVPATPFQAPFEDPAPCVSTTRSSTSAT
jgi:AraC-like DNA-binding protein